MLESRPTAPGLTRQQTGAIVVTNSITGGIAKNALSSISILAVRIRDSELIILKLSDRRSLTGGSMVPVIRFNVPFCGELVKTCTFFHKKVSI
jgi:hypothetical protein